jgi:hypothetical protein
MYIRRFVTFELCDSKTNSNAMFRGRSTLHFREKRFRELRTFLIYSNTVSNLLNSCCSTMAVWHETKIRHTHFTSYVIETNSGCITSYFVWLNVILLSWHIGENIFRPKSKNVEYWILLIVLICFDIKKKKK